MKPATTGTLPARCAVVTGGAGFLGSHLYGDFSVVAIDDPVTGSRQNIEMLRRRSRLRFGRDDITAPIEPLGHLTDRAAIVDRVYGN